MVSGIVRLSREALDRYRSAEVGPWLRAVRRTLAHDRVPRREYTFKLYTDLRHYLHRIRYAAPADPYEPIPIVPETIEYWNDGIRVDRGLGRIEDGSWDSRENCRPLESLPVYKGLEQRFERNYDWEDTVYYQEAEETIEEYGNISGYTDMEQYREIRCEYVDDLFATIREEGYRPNFAAAHDVPERDERSSTWIWNRLEPLVVIGRRGQIYLRDGRHRVVIARILGIESVPANVLARHREWQRIRDEFAQVAVVSELSPELRTYADHPDLRDLISSRRHSSARDDA